MPSYRKAASQTTVYTDFFHDSNSAALVAIHTSYQQLTLQCACGREAALNYDEIDQHQRLWR
jgi:hypothetical protein